MTDSDESLEEFLAKAEAAFEEYDQGYADADATLRRLRRHLDAVRSAVEE